MAVRWLCDNVGVSDIYFVILLLILNSKWHDQHLSRLPQDTLGFNNLKKNMQNGNLLCVFDTF